MEKQIRPCHSIHCRHYDLADGMMCEVEAARIAEHDRLLREESDDQEPFRNGPDTNF